MSDKFYEVPSLIDAVKRLRKVPHTLTRDGIAMLVEEEDDKRIYDKIGASMSEVLNMITT